MSCDRVQPKARAVALHGEEAEGWWETVRCVYPAEHEGLCSWEDHPADYQRRVEEFALPQHRTSWETTRSRAERRAMKRRAGKARPIAIGPNGIQLGRTAQEQRAWEKRVEKRRRKKKGGR